MKTLKSIIPLALYVMVFTNISYADTVPVKTTTSNKATATLSATCSISAQSVNFGSLILPLTSQSANSQINLLCTNKSPYTIELSYGGIYGSGSIASGYTMGYYAGGNGNVNIYNIYNTDSSKMGTLACYSNGTIQVLGAGVPTIFGYPAAGNYTDTNGTCNTSSMTPKDWVGAYNTPGTQSISSGLSYDYGMITGAAKGNQLAYSIAVPYSPTKVWNKGVNSYTSAGTGVLDSIPLKATLIPSKSSSSYPAPDMYSDTVTATINY